MEPGERTKFSNQKKTTRIWALINLLLQQPASQPPPQLSLLHQCRTTTTTTAWLLAGRVRCQQRAPRAVANGKIIESFYLSHLAQCEQIITQFSVTNEQVFIGDTLVHLLLLTSSCRWLRDGRRSVWSAVRPRNVMKPRTMWVQIPINNGAVC